MQLPNFLFCLPEMIDGFFRFPVKIACPVIPGQPDTRRVIEAIRQRAFKLILHLPVEPKGRSPRHETAMLKTGLPKSEAHRVIRNSNALFPGCAGVNNHMGSKGTEDAALAARGYDFVFPSDLMKSVKKHPKNF